MPFIQSGLPLIHKRPEHNKMLMQALSFSARFLMFQGGETGGLRGTVIVHLKFIFDATPLIPNCLARPADQVYI
jgi:hypothetical protein